MTVKYSSPQAACRQRRSSTPVVVTPSNWCGSSVRPLSLRKDRAVDQDTPSPAATLETER
jgi:hypothetical protein